jgi:hypothetical protein
VDAVAAYALIGGQSLQQSSIMLESSIAFSPDLESILYSDSHVDKLVLGLLSPTAGAGGAGSVRMTVENLGTVVFDQTFGDLSAMFAFFTDGTVEITPVANTLALPFPPVGVPPLFRVAFEFAFDAPDQAFSFGLLLGTSLPEPGMLLLLLLAALGVVARFEAQRRLRRRGAPQ